MIEILLVTNALAYYNDNGTAHLCLILTYAYRGSSEKVTRNMLINIFFTI